MKKITFIVWARYHRRSELFAQYLGATLHYVYYGQTRKLAQAPVRYLVQAWQTWRVLYREQPDIIFIQNPPIFAVLVAAIYARCYGARYVIDSHTAAFIGLKWSWSVPLHRRLSSGALVTIVHNTSQEKIVNRWGCRYYVLEDPISEFTAAEKFPFEGEINAVVVSSFDSDEPLEVVFEAATELSNITFYVTGDYSQATSTLLRKKPDNCRLTGYIPNQQYAGLLQGADLVLDLVNNDHTLLCGAFEAVSVGTPLIVSDWPILRECFPMGTVYVRNTVDGVRDGVLKALREQFQLRKEITLLREQHPVKWLRKFMELQQLLNRD